MRKDLVYKAVAIAMIYGGPPLGVYCILKGLEHSRKK